jgi:hypothetical protein
MNDSPITCPLVEADAQLAYQLTCTTFMDGSPLPKHCTRYGSKVYQMHGVLLRNGYTLICSDSYLEEE